MRRLRDLMDMRERVAVIAGGAGHIGCAAALALADLDAAVAVLDLDTSGAAEVAEQICAEGGTAVSIGLDLRDEESIRDAVKAVLDRFGRIDVLVNSSALVASSPLPGWTVPFAEQSAPTWRAALEVNLTGPFVLARECAPALKSSGRGSIINVGSIYGICGPDPRLYEGTEMGQPAAYAASKGGLLQLTRWLATTLAPDVRVNAVSPGGVWRNQPNAFVSRYEARTPLGRMATEEDLVGAIAYLASDLSAYVTGQNLVVDGGWTAW